MRKQMGGVVLLAINMYMFTVNGSDVIMITVLLIKIRPF